MELTIWELWTQVQQNYSFGHVRWGQAMYNCLPDEITKQILVLRDEGTPSVDPYEINSLPSLKAWVAIHLMVSDDGTVEGVW